MVGAQLSVDAPQPNLPALMRALMLLRRDKLNNEPSDRTLARVIGASPSTVGAWFGGKRFPQRIDQVLKVVRIIRCQVEQFGLAQQDDITEILDERPWR